MCDKNQQINDQVPHYVYCILGSDVYFALDLVFSLITGLCLTSYITQGSPSNLPLASCPCVL